MTDTELLQASLTGSQSAFGQIVERYKSLICAIAYECRPHDSTIPGYFKVFKESPKMVEQN